MQRARAAVQAYTMINSTIRCEFRFELGCRRPLSEAGGIANRFQRVQDFTPQRCVLRSKIQIRYSFHFSLIYEARAGWELAFPCRSYDTVIIQSPLMIVGLAVRMRGKIVRDHCVSSISLVQ